MNKKSILVIITGQLRYLSKKNYDFLLNNFSNYNLDFYINYWEDEKVELKNLFKKNYKPIVLSKIKRKNFLSAVRKIKIPDTAINLENTFHMWHSLSESFNQINSFNFTKKPDYILRYRSDILPKFNQNISLSNLNKKTVCVPDRYHWNGVNDQFYIFNFSDIKYFLNFNIYLKKDIKKNLLFSPELIFQRYLNTFDLKIKYINYDYRIMRKKSDSIVKNDFKFQKIKIPLKDKIDIKINKFKFRMRNFINFYIKKNNRNNLQNIKI